MPVQVEQPTDLEPGFVRLRGTPDRLASAADAQVRITRVDGGSPRFLDPRYTQDKAWSSAECWFVPERDAGGAGLTLGPSVTWHLKPHTPYLIAFRAGSDRVVEDRMVWKAIRLPSDAPPPSTAQAVRTSDGAGAARATQPAPAEEEAEETGDPLAAFRDMAEAAQTRPAAAAEAPPEPPRRSRVLLVALPLLAVLLAAGAVAAFYWPGFLLAPGDETLAGADPVVEPPVAETDGPALTLAGARGFLQAKPPADAAVEQAARFATAGQADAAFLLNSYAARAGNAAAALTLGDLYNPASWQEGVLKAPDADRAADYYRVAAEAGDVAAMRKLAELLDSGAVSADDAPEQAAFWRRKADEAATEAEKD